MNTPKNIPKKGRLSVASAQNIFDTYTDLIGDFGSLRPKNWKEMRFEQYMRRDPKTAQIHYGIANKSEVSEKVLHVGEEPRASNFQSSFDYCLGFRDRRTGEFVLYTPVETVKIGPKFVEDADEFLGNKTAAKLDLSKDYVDHSRSILEKRKSLVATFGSEKKKKLQKDYERRAEAEEAQSNASVLLGVSGGIAAYVHKEEDPTKAAVSGTSVILPPFNKDATEPSQVFTMTDFIDSDNMGLLKEEGEKLLAMTNDELKENGFNIIITDHINRIGWPAEEEKKVRKATTLYYLNCLISLIQHVSDRSKRGLLHKIMEEMIPNKTTQFLFKEKRFLSNSQKTRTGKVLKYDFQAADKDRLKAHALAVALMLERYVLSLRVWIIGTGCAERNMIQICQSLGCVIDKRGHGDGSSIVAKLVGPPGNERATPKKRHQGGRRH